MLRLCLVLLLGSSVFAESVRETETWVPLRSGQSEGTPWHRGHAEASGDSPHGSDFGFEDDDFMDTLYDDESSGSGDGAPPSPGPASQPPPQPDVHRNDIPEPAPPAVHELDQDHHGNDIPEPRERAPPTGERPSNVLMSHAADDSVFNKTEVFAALIPGGAVGLMLAILLILFLIYRMKKKDEGSYDLGKKPIYKKAPTTEIYA